MRFRWLDWGQDHPTVCLWAYVDVPKRFVYIYREYFKAGLLIRENAESIIRMTGAEQIVRTIIDPSSHRKSPDTGRAVKDEFARYGLYCVAGDNRERGYDIVKMFFKLSQVMIHPSCKNLINQTRLLQRSDKLNDDTTDALRYGLVDVHDTLFGGQFDTAIERKVTRQTEEQLKERRELNINNKYLFPEDVMPKRMEWLLDEVGMD